jgi:hypothetical protein
MNTANILPAGTVPADRAEAMLTAAYGRLEAADKAWDAFVKLSGERDRLYWEWYRSTSEIERGMLAAVVGAMDPELDRLWKEAWAL